jgi:hypothetical protein
VTHPLAGLVEGAEGGLGVGVALLGGQAIPPRRLAGILLHALALVVNEAQDVLGRGIALLGRGPIARESRPVVATHIGRVGTRRSGLG